MERPIDIKKRMRSVNEIRQLTRAMQLVSAAKMRRSRLQHDSVYPFFSLCAESMLEIQRSSDQIENQFFRLRKKKEGETWRIGYFVLTGDQGLAGAYNNNVVITAQEHIQEKILDNVNKGLQTDYTLYVFGNVGRDKLIHDGYHVDPDFSFPITEPTYYEAREVANIIRRKYIAGEFDLVYLIYTKMESAINMKPIISRVVPVNTKGLASFLPEGLTEAGIALEKGAVIEYEPDANAVFSFLIDTYLNAILYGALVEAYSSEQTARMTAMEHATQNADEMLKDLRLRGNRARQSGITTELTEIVNGAQSII
ncbi:MAG: ATP synthase F1 subunit gamma [Oscillospiraceae bacterium]|nr:ATP synthase F1 subunit gamma [Oscillospiraceae bacterium]